MQSFKTGMMIVSLVALLTNQEQKYNFRCVLFSNTTMYAENVKTPEQAATCFFFKYFISNAKHVTGSTWQNAFAPGKGKNLF